MRFRPTLLVDLRDFLDGLHVRGEGHVLGKPRDGEGRDREGLVIGDEGRERRAVRPEGHEEDEVHAGFMHRRFAEVHEVRYRDADPGFLEQFASGRDGEGFTALYVAAGQAPVADFRGDGTLHQYDGRTDPQDGHGHRLGRIPVLVVVDALVRWPVGRERFGTVLTVQGRDGQEHFGHVRKRSAHRTPRRWLHYKFIGIFVLIVHA